MVPVGICHSKALVLANMFRLIVLGVLAMQVWGLPLREGTLKIFSAAGEEWVAIPVETDDYDGWLDEDDHGPGTEGPDGPFWDPVYGYWWRWLNSAEGGNEDRKPALEPAVI